MDEMTATQNVDTQDVDTQDEVFEMPEADVPAFEDDDDEVFDMNMETAAEEMLQQEMLQEQNMMKDSSEFAAKFAEDWTLEPPKAASEVEPIISKFLAKKARRKA